MSAPSLQRILVVDDDLNHRRMLSLVLSNRGFEIEAAANGEEALQRLDRAHFDHILLDLRMPGLDGLATLQAIHDRGHSAHTIVMTAYAEVRTAVEAMKLGATDYLTKPIDVSELLTVIEKSGVPAQPAPALETEARLAAVSCAPVSLHFGMVGDGPQMSQVYDLIQRVAPTGATVLIAGESGTGKELVAAAIHQNSPRRDWPLLSVNCAALPEHLLESELFGHVRGAFTGAERDRIGRFEAADKGTIFLDEIGDMAPAAQAKMLRVLQEGTFEPVGSNTPKRTDVRVIAATNRDLTAEVEAGRFRRDLYYRLNIVAIHLPPLRERKEDIPALADHFISVYAERNRKRVAPASGGFLDCLMRHDWPGNVRELENSIERCVILALSDELTPDLLPPNIRAVLPGSPPDSEPAETPAPPLTTLHEAERELILRTLEACGGNQSQAARRLGISRQTLINKMKQYRS